MWHILQLIVINDLYWYKGNIFTVFATISIKGACEAENSHYCERSKTVKTEEDGRQLMMKRCVLRGTNVRYCKSISGIIAITRPR